MVPGDLVCDGKYRLKSRLGHGQMGEVWAAEHTEIGHERALKFLNAPRDKLSDHDIAARRERFKREARACAKIESDNVVQIVDVERHEGDPVLVMERLYGETLAERLVHRGKLPVSEAVAIAIDLARVIRAAHAAGVVHRDLKPENIFFSRKPQEVAGLDGRGHSVRPTPPEQLKVLDFGVSKVLAEHSIATMQGALLGSPMYMSPEQIDGKSSPGIDVWALGVILFEMLTGAPPFEGGSLYELFAKIGSAPVRDLSDVDARVARVVGRSLDRDVARRLTSAELVDALRPLVGAAFDDQPSVSWPERPSSIDPSGTSAPAPPRANAPQSAAAAVNPPADDSAPLLPSRVIDVVSGPEPPPESGRGSPGPGRGAASSVPLHLGAPPEMQASTKPDAVKPPKLDVPAAPSFGQPPPIPQVARASDTRGVPPGAGAAVASSPQRAPVALLTALIVALVGVLTIAMTIAPPRSNKRLDPPSPSVSATAPVEPPTVPSSPVPAPPQAPPVTSVTATATDADPRPTASATATAPAAPVQYGLLSIDSWPRGAVVSVDGKIVGVTRLIRHRLPIGDHEIEVRLQDQVDTRRVRRADFANKERLHVYRVTFR